MRISTSMRWLVVAVSAAMLLAVAAACSSETIEVPGETVVVEKEVIKTVEVPGETVVKEVIKEVQVPGETVVVEKVVTETVEVPGETVVVEKEVVKTVEVPGETVTVEVVKEVMVPGETVVVEKEVVKTVEVPGETVVITKEVIKTVAGPERVMVKEVRAGYVTDPTTGRLFTKHKYGGTLVFAKKTDYGGHTDQVLSARAPSMTGAVLEKLSKVDWALDRALLPLGMMFPLNTLRGGLAESWETSGDGLTMTFSIRQGVQWHDKPPMNGRELTAYDVEYTFHRYLGLGSGFTEPAQFAQQLGKLSWESIEATDKYTVVMKLKEPNIRALNLIVEWQISIQPPEVIEQYGDINDWRNLVGTGPYEITDWVIDSSFTFTKNPNYWDYDPKWPENRLPYIDELRALIIPETATTLAGLRSGKIDFIGKMGAQIRVIDQVLSLQRTNPELQLYPYSTRSDNSANMNLTKPPWNDIRVRQALQMALDLETMNDTYLKGFGDWKPRGFVGLENKDYMTPFEEWPYELQGYYTYDPAGAEALLDAAGYPRGADGIRFKTTYMHFARYDVSWTEFMVSYWREIGIDIDIETPINAEYNARLKAAEFELNSAISGMKLDPMTYTMMYVTDTPWGYAANDAQYDAWFDAAKAATTVEEQAGLIKQMDMRVIEQHWVIWGPSAPQFIVTWPWVMGYDGEGDLGIGNHHNVLQYLWIDSEMKAAMGY